MLLVMRGARLGSLATFCSLIIVDRALAVAQTAPVPRVLEFRYTPTARAQIALWIEKPDGTFIKTIGLTQAVAFRGIGNRPGAFAMNSGFHWPYGRREGALPVWAHRRAAMPGAAQFKRVIFQKRDSEGFASRTSEDSTPEMYFCLAFKAKNAPLDAVSCASGFTSDKGRYITTSDVAKSYAEPIDDTHTRALDLLSLYPPRRDVKRCGTAPPGCVDTADVEVYDGDAHAVMPDIDTVTMATPPGGDMEQSVLFAVPDDWADGDYVAWAEVNTEDDSNTSFTFATPQGDLWDSWAWMYGYSYRGQPSVVFSVPFTLGGMGSNSTAKPVGYGDVDGFGGSGGTLHSMDSSITDDPNQAPGSGVDRFRLMAANNYRFKVDVRGGSETSTGGAGGQGGDVGGTGGTGMIDTCQMVTTPSVPGNVRADHVADPKNSHQWGTLHFVVPASDQAIHNYEVRYSTSEITTSDPTTFTRALPALSDSLDTQALVVPITGAPGTSVDVQVGGLYPATTFWIAIRAVNVCAVPGPYAVAKFMTTKINFTKLSGCFVATAAYGSALEPEVESLRVARDVLRHRSALFAAATDLYYRSGPAAAAVISRSDSTRALVRTLLAPIVDLATAVESALPKGLSGRVGPGLGG